MIRHLDRFDGPWLATKTTAGTFAIPARWSDRRMPKLAHVAEFLSPLLPTRANELQLMILASGSELQQRRVRLGNPAADAAYYHWCRLEGPTPVTDTHGPTMGQLLLALDDALAEDGDQ